MSDYEKHVDPRKLSTIPGVEHMTPKQVEDYLLDNFQRSPKDPQDNTTPRGILQKTGKSKIGGYNPKH